MRIQSFKPKAFEEHVYQKLGIKIAYSARRYVETKYGAFHFLWTMEEQMVNQKLGCDGLFTAFGSITQRAQFQYNDAVKNLRILKVNRYKDDLKTQTDIAGALWMYRSIKRSTVRTMKLGFGETNDRKKDSEDLIKTKEEWYECLRALREAADLLIKWDWAPDVDDANEFLWRFTLDRNPEIEKEYAAWKEAHTPSLVLSTKPPKNKRPHDNDEEQRELDNQKQLRAVTFDSPRKKRKVSKDSTGKRIGIVYSN
ncbi:hypothetical protein DTO027B5_4238 [Paecilomyces variotii]|nr:hypothetical protein DTO027B3_4673 [Paecilomyces variotii]KAJ9333891.1 hypothetical protein DTO027B5_4238 [Paecilomyces variotii]KAJ9403713.1 hypothetical protein DTO045G8_8522 [Paecilomyces variotii]